MAEIDFSAKPYFDDYKKEKGFYKILFKPGVSVQAREMNQLQEILQQQIARLGSHIFKNGSMVIPGQSKLNDHASYVILNNVANDPELYKKLISKKLVQTVENSNLIAQVTLTKILQDGKILAIISYLNSATKNVSGNVVNVTKFSHELSISVEDDPTISISVAEKGPNNEPNTGNAITLTIESGIFYVDNYFVYTETQTTLVGWNDPYLNAKSGFIIKKDIVTAYDDESLFDNADGSPNEGAPGADRFTISLELTTLDLDQDNANFIEMLRYERGILRLLKTDSVYNVLADTLARRTYDESGDYVVNGLEVKVFDHLKDERNPNGFLLKEHGGNDNLLAIEIGKGKAYVKGYEVVVPASFYLEVNKPRTPDSIKFLNDVIQANKTGEYIYLAPGNEFFDISRHPIIWLTTGQENTSPIIGFAIPKHLEAINISGQTIFKLFGSFYLSGDPNYGWQDLGGWKINDLKNGPVLQKLTLENVSITPFNVTDGNPLTSHPGYTPYAWDNSNKILYVKKNQTVGPFNKNIQVVKGNANGYVAKIQFKESYPDGGGDLIKFNISNIKTTKDSLGNIELGTDVGFTTLITTDANGYGFYDYQGAGVFTGQPVAADTQFDNRYFDNIVNIENSGKRLVINNSSFPNAQFAVSATLHKNLEIRTKTLTEGSTKIKTPTSRNIVLAHKDVYRIKHVYVSANATTEATTSDPDIGQYYELINNDTVDFYQNSMIRAKQGFATPSGQLLVVYDYFLHSPGDAFTVDSYVSLKDNPTDENDVTHIGRIPIFTTKEKTYILSDYIDFRKTPRDGFFIIKGTVSSGSPDILVEHDYSNVIAASSKIYCNGFVDNTTVVSVDPYKITVSSNSSFTGNVYVIVNAPSAVSAIEPFNPEVMNIWTAVSGQDITYDAAYFSDRWDRVVCYKNGEIKYLYGIPGVNKYPEVPVDAMSMATLIVPAYTRKASLVNYKNDDNRRYTMRDIGKLERRIENLEYYTTLTLKELETKDLKITDANGLDRFKSGFFVSDFRDFGVFNPFNGEFYATLDPRENIVTPLEYSYSINLDLDRNNSANYIVKKDRIYLPYTDVVEIEQPYATDTETVNPYLIIKWKSELSLNPSNDTWVETEFAPTITNIHNISKTVVNDETVVINRATNESFNPPNAMSLLQTVGGSISEKFFDVVVDQKVDLRTSSSTVSSRRSQVNQIGSSVIPFMRPRTIRFEAKGMKPDTRYWAFFDGIDVNRFCRPVNPTTLVSGGWGEPLVSDPMGNLFGDFQIQPGTFKTGTKTFTIADINILQFPDAATECEASATYSANGIRTILQEVVDITNETTITVNSTTTITKETNKIKSWNPPPPPPSPPPPPPPPPPPLTDDPLAQSFFIQGNDLIPGMFVTKIDLFFRKKDPVSPVFLELREMVNGQPVENRIPGSFVALSPEQVNVSEDSTVPTTFIFEQPIWIPSGKEFCFVVSSNSSRYHLWISRLGEKVVNENRVVGKQPSLGSLFKSQNARTWTPFQLEDIKFKIYRAKFNTSVMANLVFVNNGDVAKRKINISDFYTENGSKLITVKHLNHGMQVNEIVKFQPENVIGSENNSPNGTETFNGIPMSEIYGNKVVKEVIDINHYKFEVTSSANKTGYFESVGKYIYGHSNVNFFRYIINFANFMPQGTSLRYFANLITGKDFDGGQTPKASLPESEIKNNEINYLQNVGLVQLAENEISSKSVKIKVYGTSTSDYISPVIALKDNSIIVSSYALNKPENDNEFSPKFEEGKSANKIISQVIRLKTPADTLRILTTECKAENNDIEVYYRTAINRDIDNKTWTKIEPLKSAISYDKDTFIEHERKVENIPEFDEFQIKIVLKGRNSVRRPALDELRVIALA